jgi:hypothetical protein
MDPADSTSEQIWKACENLRDPQTISPVIAISNVSSLNVALEAPSTRLSKTTFFWVSTFKERRLSEADLRTMWRTVRIHSGRLSLVNLYGGFFSICLSHAGLAGFGNGLGYSESREWPQLASTGAAPARYYLPALHQFVAPAVAALIVQTEPSLACSCSVCQSSANSIPTLSYVELKHHFALAREWEIETVSTSSPGSLAHSLRETSELYEERVRRKFPRTGLLPATGYLTSWANVIESETKSLPRH